MLARLLPGVAAIGIPEPVPTATAEIIYQQTVASVSSDAMTGIKQTERALTEGVPQIRWTETRALEMWRYTENLSTVTDLQQVAPLLGNDSEWLTAVAEHNLPEPTFLKTELRSSVEAFAMIKEQQWIRTTECSRQLIGTQVSTKQGIDSLAADVKAVEAIIRTVLNNRLPDLVRQINQRNQAFEVNTALAISEIQSTQYR